MTLTDNNMNDADQINDTDTVGADPPGAVPEELIDAVMANVDAGGVELLGENGVIAQLTKRLLERGLNEELTEHLGYELGDQAGRGSGNNRNGTSAKTGLTEIGAVPIPSAEQLRREQS